ncbi:hypothetical protein C8R46DRAFT_1078581 [Mycena filopes]|nr:hypothetical protein C8R46DRAFT_1078581 [Mycena filopes]
MPWYYGASHPIGIAGSPCTPYVVGYTLTLAQTHEVAKRLCGPRHLAMVPEHPDVGLNHHFHGAKIQEVILGFEDSGGPPYTISYLWVKGVLPSFDATKPRITIPPVDFKAGPALEGVGPVRPQCMMWPYHIAVPLWFYPRLTNFVNMKTKLNAATEEGASSSRYRQPC